MSRTNGLPTAAALCLVSLCLSAKPSMAQDFPVASLQDYRQFRESLTKAGWKPVENNAFRREDGSWTYEFPELVCGNSMCTATWAAKNGKEFSLTVWWDDAGEWRVAPQWD